MPRAHRSRATAQPARPLVPIRGWRWLVVGVAVQLIWLHVVSVRATFPVALCWLPCLGLASGMWFLWGNRRRRGLWVMAAGAGLNALVMLANGGLMPLAPGALPRLGAEHRITTHAVAQSKDRLLSDTRAHLAILDDRLRGAVGGVRIAASLGDLLVAGGVLITLSEELLTTMALWRACPAPARQGLPPRQRRGYPFRS